MALETTFKITVEKTNKVDAAVLALEFWSSKGFKEHDASHNILILRTNGYGNLLKTIAYNFTEECSFFEAPLQMTLSIQPRPAKVIYIIKFESVSGLAEVEVGDFHSMMDVWINEFLDFMNEWINKTP